MSGRTARGGRWVTAAVVLAVVPWAVWCAVRLAGAERGFPLVPALAFTPYAAATAVVPLAFALLLRRWRTAAAAAAVALGLASAVVPRAVAAADAPGPQGPELRVLTLNMFYGEADPEAVVDLVRAEDADVLSLQEVTPRAVDRLADAGLGRLLGHGIDESAEGAMGGAIYARYPLKAADRPPDEHFPNPRARLTVPGGAAVEVVAAHTVPPYAADLVGPWTDTVGALPPATPDGPLRVIAGDLNATLDHAALRDVIATGYVDAADTTGDGWRATWPVDRSVPGLAIDHVLVDRRAGVERVGVSEVPGTDHRAVLAVLRLPPA
ncbi:endonuclease/exonuclease/phosphatase family protein [Murinocardiopsis flavida]|uniref:endonuclease/exonuclease/phosphatase family protein n=1 Tax=Murinocardiopsis flavida TaxID=645275 RepID=UPI000D0D1795|nr:endonuclease/exonuclease/phosphatase family protein [Murinocardiopsis flavida]